MIGPIMQVLGEGMDTPTFFAFANGTLILFNIFVMIPLRSDVKDLKFMVERINDRSIRNETEIGNLKKHRSGDGSSR